MQTQAQHATNAYSEDAKVMTPPGVEERKQVLPRLESRSFQTWWGAVQKRDRGVVSKLQQGQHRAVVLDIQLIRNAVGESQAGPARSSPQMNLQEIAQTSPIASLLHEACRTKHPIDEAVT